ncbi:hypothetical protein RRG08_042727 [Elysia crispata]|uniref:Uncharacterized protein n=1 Tax=Elysia crispata TaxID=231223 RepID=A0AAE1CKG3_9GAST|nr:hypothetical protein RRG08_042727 [Elysia crispata]
MYAWYCVPGMAAGALGDPRKTFDRYAEHVLPLRKVYVFQTGRARNKGKKRTNARPGRRGDVARNANEG